MSYKTTDGLMRHLRENGIDISGSKEKRQLVNTGYFHGYKGYRYFGRSDHPIPFNSYKDIYATIEYDADLKALFYPKIMFIETAVKNIALESIMMNAKSESIQSMFDKVIESYKNVDGNKKKSQERKLKLQSSIQTSLSKAYKYNDPKICHYYENEKYSGVPVWALFEILMLGDFGSLLSCLTYDVRNDISNKLHFNLSADTNRVQVYAYIFIIKDLRNAIAHNSAVFDTRFKNYDVPKAVYKSMCNEIGLKYINFKSITDYVILVAYYLKCLGVSKTEIISFLKQYDNLTQKYCELVDDEVGRIVVRNDYKQRINTMKDYL